MAIPESIWRMVLTSRLHGQTCQNTLWFRSKTSSTIANMQAAADLLVSDFDIGWRQYYIPCLSAEVQLLTVVATCMSIPNTAQSFKSYTTVFGGQAGESSPSFVASVLGFFTGVPGRRTHGRMYLPGIPEADHTGSVLTSAALARHGTLALQLRLRYGISGTSGTFFLVVYSKKNGAVRQPGPPPFISYLVEAGVPVQDIVVNTALGTRRSRMLGRGV